MSESTGDETLKANLTLMVQALADGLIDEDQVAIMTFRRLENGDWSIFLKSIRQENDSKQKSNGSSIPADETSEGIRRN